MRYPVFLAFSGPATLAWASGSVLLGVFFGASGERIIQTFGLGAVLAVAVVLLAALSVVVVRRRRAARADSTSSDTAPTEHHPARR
jgi:membrane protein DedA with SNARE-associated domain